ncbi:MAG: bifunctional acetaldehyde-CoA/alcohol dehydrogenase [Clostridia bacterium]|nr:bifunctional acetaldehyde-CoA/alcohol dehydrogenase [Clostridia bacterium]
MMDSKAIDEIINNAKNALNHYMSFTQEKIDYIIKKSSDAGLDHHVKLAKEAVKETGLGIYEDKVAKNIAAVESLQDNIQHLKTVGVVGELEGRNCIEIAEPMGIIAALTPFTSPTSITIFKCMMALKTRNPIIFSFHPRAHKCSLAAAEIIRDAALQAGAPRYCIQWIEKSSPENAQELIYHPGISLILAAGEREFLEPTHRPVKPILWVGPANVPCYIENSAEIQQAVNDLVISKTFDNGMHYCSEQTLVVDKNISDEVMGLLENMGGYFPGRKEIRKLENLAAAGDNASLNPEIVGRNAGEIAKMAGLEVPKNINLLVIRQDEITKRRPLLGEKLCPLLAYHVVENYREGIRRCSEIVELGKIGHTAVIHTENKGVVELFSKQVTAARIIVNAPAAQGTMDDLYNITPPSFSLGSSYQGHSEASADQNTVNLLNIKRVTQRESNKQFFKIPSQIYFEPGAIQQLSKIPGIKKAFIVTDNNARRQGYVDRINYFLDKHKNQISTEVFDDVVSNPSMDTICEGCEAVERFNPDTIIALGGEAVIDTAKGIWLFYEHPEIRSEFLKCNYLDVHRRTYRYPRENRKTRLVAVPITHGRGAEVSSFTAITHEDKDLRYPLTDYELTPSVAIVDPDIMLTLPGDLMADMGMDILSHAVEAYLSVLASDFTDALALKAIQLVFNNLPRIYRDSTDDPAKIKIYNASTIAGMALANAHLGVCHALANKIGEEFHIPRGKVSGTLLPHVIIYNASPPAKPTVWPKHNYYRVPVRYQEIAEHLGLQASTPEKGVANLVGALEKLLCELNIPTSIAGYDVNKEEYLERVPLLAQRVSRDQSIMTNPRVPLISELKEILKAAYEPRPTEPMELSFPGNIVQPETANHGTDGDTIHEKH